MAKEKDNNKLTDEQLRNLLDNFAFGNLFGQAEESSIITKIVPIINLALTVLLMLLIFLK